jgi:2-(1,2-epoxy-1,2-dihydrophenyl)acetyl-CoA isomerase
VPTAVEVAYLHDGAVASITLRRPERGNSVTPEVCAELADAVESVPPTVICTVLGSVGPIFCAGADMVFLERIAQDQDERYIREVVYERFQRLVRSLSFAPMVTVARVQGAAVGAGADIALACDIRIASTTAFLQESWINLGLISALGGTRTLPAALGRGSGLLALLTAQRIPAARALAGGLFQQVVSADELDAAVATVTGEIAARDPDAVRAMKALVCAHEQPDRDAALAAALEAQVRLLMSPTLPARVAELRAAVRS